MAVSHCTSKWEAHIIQGVSEIVSDSGWKCGLVYDSRATSTTIPTSTLTSTLTSTPTSTLISTSTLTSTPTPTPTPVPTHIQDQVQTPFWQEYKETLQQYALVAAACLIWITAFGILLHVEKWWKGEPPQPTKDAQILKKLRLQKQVLLSTTEQLQRLVKDYKIYLRGYNIESMERYRMKDKLPALVGNLSAFHEALIFKPPEPKPPPTASQWLLGILILAVYHLFLFSFWCLCRKASIEQLGIEAVKFVCALAGLFAAAALVDRLTEYYHSHSREEEQEAQDTESGSKQEERVEVDEGYVLVNSLDVVEGEKNSG